MITTAAQQRKYVRSLKGRIRMGLKRLLGKSLGMARKDLRAKAPVDTGEYRKGILAIPVRLERNRLIGEIVFEAEHSKYVHAYTLGLPKKYDWWKSGYHPGLSQVLDRIPREVSNGISDVLRVARAG